MTADRKAIRRSIIDLIEAGYEIEYSESIRMVPKAKTGELEESYIWSDFYLVRDFTDSELRLLIDGVLFSGHNTLPQNDQLFWTVELLDEAIAKGRKVRFRYLEYGTDKKLHERTREDGSAREYVVSPYQMAAKEGKYYLICNYDKYDDISNYRIDRNAKIELPDEPVKPFESLPWAKSRRLDLAEYMREHIYMYSSESVRMKFRVVKPMISDVIDVFGTEVRFFDETAETVTVSAMVNEMAMLPFARSFAPDVVVLEPK